MTLARIGRFQVERALGSGSFATVWLARDEDLDGWVAIKLLAENWSLNEDARRRFMAEARALRRLDSDRIVRVYEVGRLNDGRPYMVMEFADRGTLEDRMRLRAQLDQPYSIEEALVLAMEMAECLIAVHDLRIVHRDVKPSNVLFRGLPPERQEALRRDGKPVATERTLLGDFGIARRMEGVLGHTMVVGSPQYMAPEQADPARAAGVDFRSDVYSAAVILFELLAGRLPFGFESMTELRSAPPAARPPEIRQWRSDVPSPLAAVIERGLAREPAHRFPSAWEWRDALRDSISGGAEATAARDGSVAPPVAVMGPPSSVDTVPGGTRRRTAVLQERPLVVPTAPSPPPRPPGQFDPLHSSDTVGAPAPTWVNVRVPGAWAVLAGVMSMASLALPWARVQGPDGVEDRLGTAFRGGGFAALGAIALFLLGLRMWRTRRRWVAAVAAWLVLVVGSWAVVLAVYEAMSVGGDGASSGLDVLLGGGLIAVVAGWRALRRLRHLRRREVFPRLRSI